MSKQRKMILISAAVGIIGMFLPWESVFGYSVNGMHGSGVFVFICLLAGGFLALSGDQTTNLNKEAWMAVLITGAIATLIMVINFFDASGNLSLVGIGFYAALAGSIGVVAFAFKNRSSTDTLQGGFDSLKDEINRKMNTPNTTPANTTTTTTVSHTTVDDPTRPVL